ncbi:hypothetical protein GYMLUDRAFT_958929 [Collybiopsis luxurians FD-317 M1]|nr:hypothetical protein GYMLUDRAFT_958929 [Collybiopsis luxurians FD-317 M1]
MALAKANEIATAAAAAATQEAIYEDAERQRDASNASKNVATKKKTKGKKAETDAGKIPRTPAPPRPPRLDLETILQNSHYSIKVDRALNPRTNEESLFASFSSFEQLASVLPNRPTALQKTLLLSSTIRTLEAVSRVLKSVLPSPSSSNYYAASDRVESIQTLNVLLTHLLSTTVAILFPKPTSELQADQKKPAKKKKKEKLNSDAPKPNASTPESSLHEVPTEEYSVEFWSSFESLLDTLTTLLLQPLVRAFVSVSHAHLVSILAHSSDEMVAGKTTGDSGPPPNHSANLVSDIRPDLLSLFRGALLQISHLVVPSQLPGVDNYLASDQSYVLGIKECLSLTARRACLR